MNANTGVTDSTQYAISSHCSTTSFKALGAVALVALATFGVLGILQASGHLPHAFSWLDLGLGQVGNQAAFGAMLAAAIILPAGAFGVIQACKAKQGAEEDLEEALQRLGALHNQLGASAGEKTIREQIAEARKKPIEPAVQEELDALDKAAKKALKPGEPYRDSHKVLWISIGGQVRKMEDVIKELEG